MSKRWDREGRERLCGRAVVQGREMWRKRRIGRGCAKKKMQADNLSLHKEKYFHGSRILELTASPRARVCGCLWAGENTCCLAEDKGCIFFCLPFHWWPRADIHLRPDSVGGYFVFGVGLRRPCCMLGSGLRRPCCGRGLPVLACILEVALPVLDKKYVER